MTSTEELAFYQQYYERKLTEYFSKELTPERRMKISTFFKMTEDLRECKMVYALLVQCFINQIVARIETDTKINWEEVPVKV